MAIDLYVYWLVSCDTPPPADTKATDAAAKEAAAKEAAKAAAEAAIAKDADTNNRLTPIKDVVAKAEAAEKAKAEATGDADKAAVAEETETAEHKIRHPGTPEKDAKGAKEANPTHPTHFACTSVIRDMLMLIVAHMSPQHNTTFFHDETFINYFAGETSAAYKSVTELNTTLAGMNVAASKRMHTALLETTSAAAKTKSQSASASG